MNTWITASGEKLKIEDMETSHIENCIRMLDKRINEAQDFMANWDWEFGMLSLADAEDYKKKAVKKVKAFKKELKRRGLSGLKNI